MVAGRGLQENSNHALKFLLDGYDSTIIWTNSFLFRYHNSGLQMMVYENADYDAANLEKATIVLEYM